MKLNPTTEKFVLHWGEMGSKWGVNRTVAQIHALLYLIGKPMNAEEIVETLGVARSNVSNSIKELQSLNLVQTTHILGDRRDYFTTNTDVWALARIIMEERYKRELAPTVAFYRPVHSAERKPDSNVYACRSRQYDCNHYQNQISYINIKQYPTLTFLLHILMISRMLPS